MFRIRNDQVTHFAWQTRTRFSRRTTAYIREYFPEAMADLSPGECEAWVRYCVLKVEEYGVVYEPEATQIICFFILLGSDAEQKFTWARDVLRDPQLVGMGKARALLEAARDNGQPEIDNFIVLPELEDPDAVDADGEAEAS